MIKKTGASIVLLALFLLLLLFPLPLAAASGGVRNMTQGLSYDTILEAVAAADADDTIEVAAGTYAETDTIVIGKPLTLRAAAGAAAVIDGGSNSEIFAVESPGVVLEGLTLIGADYSSVAIDFDTPGFQAETSARRFSLLNCTLEGDDCTDTAIKLFGVIEHAEITIRGNTIRNYTEYGFESYSAHEYIDSAVTVESNAFENAGLYGIDLDIPATGTDILIAGNTVTAFYDAIYLDAICGGSSVTIRDNTLSSPDETIYVSGEIDGGTLVIEGNCITSEEDNGIDLSWPIRESTLTFDGNTFLCGEGSALYFGDDLFECSVTITANEIGARYGVFFDYDLEDTVLTMEGNRITSDYGFYIYRSATSSITLQGNSFMTLSDESDDSYAVCMEEHSAGGISLLGNLFTGAARAIDIHGGWEEPEGDASAITIAGNLFKDNETGILLAWAGQIDLTISFNAFLGNEDDLLFDSPTAPGALLNWWGTATGPTGLSEGITFDPWLAALILTPDRTAGVEGESCTITVKLQDSDSALAATDLLVVRFTVTGAHSLTRTVPLVNGMATLQYIGNPAGVDTITAEVLFAGETVGLGGQTQLTWEAKPAEPEPPGDLLPPTSGQAGHRLAFGIALLLAAVAALFCSRRAAAAS